MRRISVVCMSVIFLTLCYFPDNLFAKIDPLSLTRGLVEPLIDSPGKTVGSDFNGDGIHDIAAAAHLNNDGGGADAGAVYLLYGTASFSNTYRLDGAGVDVTVLGKAAGDNLGLSISSSGDVNSDGFDDLIMGARLNNDGTGADDAGAVYILYGSPNLSQTYQLNGVGVNVTILGDRANAYLGFSLSLGAAGDVNGDGFDDIVAGAYGTSSIGLNAGAAFVLYGSASLSATYLIDGGGVSVTLLGKAASDRFGVMAQGAGDVNKDGFDDLLFGAHLNDDGATANAGAAYILFGSSSLSATYRMDGAGVDTTVLGHLDYNQLGITGSGLGDLNGDGFHDTIIGANFGGDLSVGAAYVIYGRSGFASTIDITTSQQDISIIGRVDGDELGLMTSVAGDLNDDGLPDITVGARVNDDNGTSAGSAYVIFGGVSLASTINAGNSDMTILGKAANASLGRGLSGVGDVNNDGFPDLLVGSYLNDDIAVDAGAAYIIFGAESLSSTINLAGAGPSVSITGKAGSDDFGISTTGGRGAPGP